MFKIKQKCQHEYETIGMFYKEILAEYRNCFDVVRVYEKRKCKKCGCIENVLLVSESFLPERFNKRDRKDKYIEHLINNNIKFEIDLHI